MAISPNIHTANFRGAETLIDALDEAMQGGDVSTVTQSIKLTLSALIGNGDLELPPICYRTSAGHYQRRELYRSERYGYSVVAMSWAPEQGTALHDHGGLWCVEGVCSGCLEVEQYELTEQEGELCHFVPRCTHVARTGAAGSLIPPYEYHRIVNSSAFESAVSLHIYERTMTECHVYEPRGDGWYSRANQPLCFDN